MGQQYSEYARVDGTTEETMMPESQQQVADARQNALLEQAMKQPGVNALTDAYSTIEAAYSNAAAATAVTPVVITTNTSR